MRVPITVKWFFVHNCDKDEWKIIVGNMKNDVGIWMFIKNRVDRKAARTLHFCLPLIHTMVVYNIKHIVTHQSIFLNDIIVKYRPNISRKNFILILVYACVGFQN